MKQVILWNGKPKGRKTKVEDKGESEEATVGIESDGRRKEIADETTQVAEINKKYKSQQKVETFFCL